MDRDKHTAQQQQQQQKQRNNFHTLSKVFHCGKFLFTVPFSSCSTVASFGSQTDLHTPQKLGFHMGKHCEYACEFLLVLMKLF